MLIADTPIYERPDRVLDCAEAFALRKAVTDKQRRTMDTAFQGLRLQIAQPGPEGDAWPAYVHLPLMVYAGLRGDEVPAIPLAASTTMLFLGLDLFDDVADGDCPEGWSGRTAAEINLAAATLLCALPQLAISELDAPVAVIAAMQRTLAEGLLKMSAGQEGDLAAAGASCVDVREVEASVAQKSGEEMAIFARLAAQLAEASPDQIEAYGELGCAIGTAGQLASDCYELFHDPRGRDFLHGARTLPVALHLERLAGRERVSFLELLERARREESARDDVRARLRSAGELRRCAFIVETYCQRALRLCDELAPLEPARSRLLAMISGITFFREKEAKT